MPLYHITNLSHGPRGFHEKGSPVPRVLEIGEGGEFDLDLATADIAQRMHDRKEVAMVNLSHRLQPAGGQGERLFTAAEMDAEIARRMAPADPGAAGRAVAEAMGTSTEQRTHPADWTPPADPGQTHEERLTADGQAPAEEAKDGPVDISLLDDDQLRMLIEQGTGRAPHAQLGRKKLEEQAAPFLTPKEA